MGWFTTSSSKRPSRPNLEPASLTSPPNIYTSSTPSLSPPIQPRRPAATSQYRDHVYDHTYDHVYLHHHRPAIAPPQLDHPGHPHQQACPPYSGALVPCSNGHASSPPSRPNKLGRWSESMVDLVQVFMPSDATALRTQFATSAAVANATYDDIKYRFDNVMTLIDQESLSGHESKLFQCQEEPGPSRSLVSYDPPLHYANAQSDRGFAGKTRKGSADSQNKKKSPSQAVHVATSVVKGNYFSKVELYANSKLPSSLPCLRLSSSAWPLLNLAAQYSHRVYNTPSRSERDAHISSSLLSGTKAMRIKSVSMDHASTIVFAIRGTASFSDWAVNLNTAPSPPTNFLDDPGNLCHAGFLSTARKMIKPVAARLRQLLEEDPSRANHSLLMTGHSAGGAVAALLYSHMQSEAQSAKSELSILAGYFKRIHCITFGAPPISLLPLKKPHRRRLRKSLFLSFLNEGDPVARADKAYVKSLVQLLTNPPPSRKRGGQPEWKVPPATLSTAGIIVVLRAGDPRAVTTDYKTVNERLREGVVAVTCKEEGLRRVVWGDPVAHMMSLYAGRMQVLAGKGGRRRK